MHEEGDLSYDVKSSFIGEFDLAVIVSTSYEEDGKTIGAVDT